MPQQHYSSPMTLPKGNGGAAMPQRTFLIMLIVVCVTILCFVWMVRDSLCGFRIEQGNTVLVATLAYEVKR